MQITLSNKKTIGDNCPCFIVAEIGNNHQGRFELAVKLIHKAKECGVDAVKFQKRDINSLLTYKLYNKPYKGENSFGNTYGKHREKLELSIEEFAKLKQIAEEAGLIFFASPWDFKSLDELSALEIEIIKISSADLTNIPFLREAAKQNKPIFLSTGMSTVEQIDRAVNEIKKINKNLVLLQCTSAYPADYEELALPVIAQLKHRYNVLVGYSGHEIGIYPSIAAVCFGACVVERHFTLDKSYPGTDHKLSLDPNEMKEVVKGIRAVEKSMKQKSKKVFDNEKKVMKKLRKSIVAAKNIEKGDILSDENLTVKSPGTGLSPEYWDVVIGKKTKKNIEKDDFILLDDLI